MKQFKRLAALLLAASLLLASLAGCGKKEEQQETTKQAETTKKAETTKQAETTKKEETTKSEEPITLHLLCTLGDRVFDPETANNQYILEQLKEKFNVELVVEKLENTDAMNMRFASGEIGDIVYFGAFDSFEYADSGLLLDISDLWEQSTTRKEHTKAESVDTLRLGDELYALPYENNYVKYFTQIRKDWLVNLGYDVEQWPLLNDDTDVRCMSLEDFTKILYEFTYDDPDGNGVNDTYGLSYYSAADAINSLMMFYGCFGGVMSQYYLNGNTAYSFETSDGYREALEYISDLWADGVIDPELYILQKDQAKANLMAGKSGCFNSWWSSAYELIRDGMRDLQPTVDWLTVSIDNNGVGGMKNNGTITGSVAISAACEHPEVAMQVLDFLSTDDIYMMIRYGVPEEDYEVDPETGFYNGTRTEKGQALFTENRLDSLYIFTNRIDLENKANSIPPTDEIMLIRYGMLLHQFLTDAPLYQSVFYGLPSTEAYTTYGADVKTCTLQYNMKFVTGELELNDANWDAYLKAWEAVGGMEVLESYVEECNEMKGTSYEAGLK